MTVMEGIEPAIVWKYFEAISAIPHGSKNEQAISDYIKGVGESLGLETVQDEALNVVIRKPATPGNENKPIVVLQGHMDMVCEKNSDVDLDFKKDGIQLDLRGDWLYAKGTTLGADNGIGVAAGLAVLESTNIAHGPVECLFTTDEETGLNGAFNLSADILKGRMMWNLDTEEEGAIYIGCAGGADTKIALPAKYEPVPAGYEVLNLKISGMHGGHSGVDIHEQRANAVKLLVISTFASSEGKGFRVASFHGGDKHNAIPREADAVVAIESGAKDAFVSEMNTWIDGFKAMYKTIDPDIALEVSPGSVDKVLDADTTKKLFGLGVGLNHGVKFHSYEIDMVETSANLASIHTEDEVVRFYLSSRSSVPPSLEYQKAIHRALAAMAGAQIEEPGGYPGWTPDLESKSLKVAKAEYTKILGREPEVKAIHAGLECGIIGEKFGGMDMVSIGPQIEHPHSPDERVKVPSVAEFWQLLVAMLEAVE